MSLFKRSRSTEGNGPLIPAEETHGKKAKKVDAIAAMATQPNTPAVVFGKGMAAFAEIYGSSKVDAARWFVVAMLSILLAITAMAAVSVLMPLKEVRPTSAFHRIDPGNAARTAVSGRKKASSAAGFIGADWILEPQGPAPACDRSPAEQDTNYCTHNHPRLLSGDLCHRQPNGKARPVIEYGLSLLLQVLKGLALFDLLKCVLNLLKAVVQASGRRESFVPELDAFEFGPLMSLLLLRRGARGHPFLACWLAMQRCKHIEDAQPLALRKG